MLGNDLLATHPRQYEATAAVDADGRRIDITDPSAVEGLLDRTRPAIVVNAAAYTKVDQAEVERDSAHTVNAVAPAQLARECESRGVRLVHFSTDYVFSGQSTVAYTENDAVNPLNEYGRSKLLGEQAVLRECPSALVVRTQWLFGGQGSSFPRTMWDRAMRGLRTRVVADQWGRPTYTPDLAEATWDLVEQACEGLVHVANDGAASWFDVAEAIFSSAGALQLLEPCSTADYPTRACRPAFSVLNTERAERLLGRALPSWRDALGRFLRAELAPQHG